MSEVGTSGWTFNSHMSVDGGDDDNIRANLNHDMCRAWKSSSQSITHSTWTWVTFDTELYDYRSMHSTTANTSYFTVPRDGIYHVEAQIQGQASLTNWRVQALEIWNSRSLMVVKGDSQVTSGWPVGHTPFMQINGYVSATGGDYLELRYYQRNTANASRSIYAWLSMARVSGRDEDGDPR